MKQFSSEDVLIQVHADQYKGVDDDMIDDFQDWLMEQNIDDIILWIDKAVAERNNRMKAIYMVGYTSYERERDEEFARCTAEADSELNSQD